MGYVDRIEAACGGLAEFPERGTRHDEPAIRTMLRTAFLARSRDEWTDIFTWTDACVTPVLNLTEAAAHPHNQARGTFNAVDGVMQPAPPPDSV